MDGGNELPPLLRSQTSVDLSRNGEEVTDLTGKVHQLPCCIKYDGSTSVSDYFKPKSSGMEVDGLRVEEAYFRGRKLHGTTLPLPSGYSGFILGKKSSDEKTNTETSYCWEANAKFQNVTVWNHDSLPSNDDAFLRSFHWFSVAKAWIGDKIVINTKSYTNLVQNLHQIGAHGWRCPKYLPYQLHQPVNVEDLESVPVDQDLM